MTTGKTIAMTRWTCVGKVMSLIFNMLSKLVITFLPKTGIMELMEPGAYVLRKPNWMQSLERIERCRKFKGNKGRASITISHH